MRLSRWIEANLRLPEGVSALPGAVRLWPYQYAIADAISDPMIERVTLVKPVRVGFTTILSGAIGSFVANEPSPILALLPTEADCRDYMVSDIEPIFDATPALRGMLAADEEDGGRNTLLSRRFPGGSLKIVAAKAPRNLRRHTARVLIVDEADAMDAGAEGNPIRLGERRTLTFANRKIIIGSTPILEDTSAVLRAYSESDRRIFEVPCLECGEYLEIQWAHIVWPEGKPEEASFQCPGCGCLTADARKAEMVYRGRWTVSRPEVVGHAGFRLNALVSLVANATWPMLAKEFVAAKSDPAELQVFTNTILAQGWSTPAMINEGDLAARAEPWGLDDIPPEVLVITAGTDVQDDRVETVILGWTREFVCYVLGHIVIWGSFTDQSTWDELDELLRTTWRHPYGGRLKVDAAAIDAGDGDHYEAVLSFCVPKISRRIFATKGMGGARPGFQMAKGKTIAGRLHIIGTDTIKNIVFDRLQRGRGIRFSRSLEPIFYEQVASERRVLRYKAGRPTLRFEAISTRRRSEALDALVYGSAVRSAVTVNLDRREAEVRQQAAPRASLASLLPR